MDQALIIVISVLTSVATLLLISVGLAVIFGSMRVINLAHGEFLMLGAYAVLVATRNGISVWIAIPLAGVSVGIFGLVVERLLIRPLYGRILDTLLATWGLSLVLVQAVSIVFGPATNGIGTPLGSVHVGGYSFSQYSLVLITMALITLTAVYLLFTRTRYGVMARAAIQNPAMARALGIDTARMSMLTFGIGSGLAGLAVVVGCVGCVSVRASVRRAVARCVSGGLVAVRRGLGWGGGGLSGFGHTAFCRAAPYPSGVLGTNRNPNPSPAAHVRSPVAL